jgi:anthranilate/para-aminobenzoate synthase component II
VNPSRVVVDHYDSRTWNLVRLAVAVTGVLLEVVAHDATSAAQCCRSTGVGLGCCNADRSASAMLNALAQEKSPYRTEGEFS